MWLEHKEPNTSPCPSSELASPLFRQGITSPFILEKDIGFLEISTFSITLPFIIRGCIECWVQRFLFFQSIGLGQWRPYCLPFPFMIVVLQLLNAPTIIQWLWFWENYYLVYTCIGIQHPFRLGILHYKLLFHYSSPYPGYYRPAFAFSSIPYPLILPLPLREGYHSF